jgi:hypothetical protein
VSTWGRFVHEFSTASGARYAVAEYANGQYVRPFDASERRLTGCLAECARVPSGVQSYRSRRRALRRARYLFAS